MSLQGRGPRPAASKKVAAEFHERFVRDAHTLVALGHSRLDRSTLARKKEEAISGLIVKKVEEWLETEGTPGWAKAYCIKDEVPERSSPLEGKDRPRIDIWVECTHPRVHFVFEAKRLYRSDSVANYTGEKGLGAFLDGTYEPGSTAAGMLGYVQGGLTAEYVEKLRLKLDSERALHGLPKQGEVWVATTISEGMGSTWVSRHTRLAPKATTVTVYHSFLRCCADPK